jgi:hypothetical protein
MKELGCVWLGIIWIMTLLVPPTRKKMGNRKWTSLFMFTPITEKIFVLAKRAYRIATGSRAEMIFLTLAIGHVSSRGGFRAMMLSLMGNYQMAVEAYQREGTTVCNMEGRLRFPDGETAKSKKRSG